MHRIHPKNRPLITLPKDHPAHAALIAHLACCRECVGREIPWPGHEAEAIDQQWHSTADGRVWSFSGFAYAFLSFDLVLDEWLEPELPFDAKPTLAHIKKLVSMLDECEIVCRQDENTGLLNLIPIVRRFLACWETSVRLARSQSVNPVRTS